ncbi:EAL domain-containing protein [Halomonas daqingensis]|uniref:EAL domain-containing protein n=1 Tax=Billgrantia desiderata TaxID=52021 RepID=A0ABS9B249_9GAMM|nr:EAL domain-containing protein [Halomonas desiderata]MCE8041696.1 EAL domain-containing protein [Halomonas desiderata]MCE8046271.1 EAL domain-containing protein [Halomonas desiderata]
MIPQERFKRWLLRFLGRTSVNATVDTVENDEAVALVRQQYLESEQRFRALLESLPKVAVQGYDRDRRVIYWNEASTRLYGYTSDEALGGLLEELIIPDFMREGVIHAHRAWIQDGIEIPPEELELKHKSGELVPVFSHHVMLKEHTEDPLMFCVDVDLSDQKQAHRELEFATRYDRLTQLPNRQTFESDLEYLLDGVRRRGVGLALLYLDIDYFVEINDALGYEQGDQLLVELSRRLRNALRSTDLLSRVSSDEFVLAFPGLHREEDVLQVVNKIHDLFKQPFGLDGHERRVSASIGVCLFPDNGGNARELIRNADVAKNRAKLEGRGSIRFFHQHLHDELVREHRLAENLEHALSAGELSLHYQPQVSAVSGRIENLEALLRWELPGGVAVPPHEFIRVAERSGLIHRLGDWVIEEACRQRTQWRAAGVPLERIDINVSGRQLSRPDFFGRLRQCLSRHGLGPREIGIELTENVLIEADERILEGLWGLYHLGFRIAIDDFGTGFSSLSYLKRFPVTALKIDRTFVRDAPGEPKDRAIMEAAVFIGHRLGLEVVAEGVEDERQLELIREMKCDLVQGYYFYRPMPAAMTERVLLGLVTAPGGVQG